MSVCSATKAFANESHAYCQLDIHLASHISCTVLKIDCDTLCCAFTCRRECDSIGGSDSSNTHCSDSCGKTSIDNNVGYSRDITDIDISIPINVGSIESPSGRRSRCWCENISLDGIIVVNEN